MSAHVIEFIKWFVKDKVRGFAENFISFPNEFNKFNNTGARMQDSVYHIILKSLSVSDFRIKTSRFCH